jgi:cell division protein FtsW
MTSTNAAQATFSDEVPEAPAWGIKVDAPLLICSALLMMTGLVLVASSSIAIADRGPGSPLGLFWHQAAYATAALTASAGMCFIEMNLLRKVSGVLLICSILSLAILFVPGIGQTINGSTRWLSLGIANLQPSEFVKLAVVLYLGGYLVRRAEEVRSSMSGFFKPVLILIIIAVLLLLEPDFGATAVVFTTALAMLFLGGVPLRTFFGWMGLIGGAMAVVLMAAPYRMKRLTTFMDPWADPFDSGFQLAQALIAIGRGDWFGVGLGASVQKLFYLPEAHTDFLFAVLGEEFGFVGMTVVMGLFAVLVWRGFSIAREAADRGDTFSAHVAHGLALLLGLQAIVNIGVNMGVLPTKGLTLPLMSYGGSSLLASSLAVAMLLRVSYETRRAR